MGICEFCVRHLGSWKLNYEEGDDKESANNYVINASIMYALRWSVSRGTNWIKVVCLEELDASSV